MEIKLIKELKSNEIYGYNNTLGGDGICMPEEERIARSKKYSGTGNPYYGKKHSYAIRKLMSKNHYDVSGGNNPRAKKIYQFDLWGYFIKEYPSGRDAARELGTSDGMVNAAIHKDSFSGFLWAHEDNIIFDNGIICMKEIPLVNRGTNGIYQFDLDGNFIGRYKGYKEAAKFNPETNVAGIARAAKGLVSQHKNYIWKYYDGVRKSKDIPGSFCIV